jgi:hypothetical protein
LWAEGLSANDIHKELFPDYGGKCLLRKAVRNWGSLKITLVADVSLMMKRLKLRCVSG